MDLTSLYRMVSAEAPSVPEQMMRGAANQAALQQADEQLMANKRLRDLYSSGGQPSMQDLMSIDPRLGIEMQQAQFKNMLEAGQIEKLNREKDESDAKVYAQHIAPIAQDYFDNIKNGMPEQQAAYKFKFDVGNAQSQIEQRFGIKPKVDFSQYPPLQIAQRAHALGVDIPHLKEIEEQQKNQFAMQQKMSPGYADVAGRTEAGPYGPRFVPPAPIPGTRQPRGTGLGGAPATQMPDGYQRATAEDLPMLEQEYENATDVNEKQMIGSLINQLKQQTQFVTPEQEAAKRIAEEKGKKTAQLEAEKEATVKQREEILSSIPDRKEIEGLIDKSIASGLEQQVKGKLAGFVGASSEALAATKQLDVIAPQLKSITKSLAGAGAISDFEQKMMADAAGAIADPNVPADARKAAFRTFMDIMEKADKSGTSKAQGLQVGHEENGYRFKGGNPADKSSWEKM